MNRQDPLVLLPGMNCSSMLWSRLALPTTGIVHRALTEPTLDTQVDRLLDELPSRFALVGLSLGAIVAMAVTRRAPERVSALTLLSTNPYAPTPAQLAAWTDARDQLAAGRSARELQSDWLPSLLSPAVMTGQPDLVALTAAMAGEVGESALDAQLTLQSTRIDERPGLDKLRCPVTVVAAAGDVLCPVARHREIVARIPGARLTIVARSGHLSPLEQPGRVAAALKP